MSWWQRFGTKSHPVRQSSLNDIASQNGCAKRFVYDTEAELAEAATPRELAPWKMTMGTAVHAVVERGLTRAWPQLVTIFGPDAQRPAGAGEAWAPANLRARIDETLREELERASRVDEQSPPRRIDWRDEHPETEIAAGVAMAIGALRTAVERARSIVACEVPFAATIDVPLASGKTNTYHLEGTIDLVYRRRIDDAVCLADWKTGARKLDQILLDYGYQTSIYAYALEHGVLWPGTERETRLSVWPAEMHIVHLRDFVPYVKKPRTPGKKVGDLRGPGWSPSKRVPQDVARLRESLRNVVTSVRMGLRMEMLGEQCRRCPHKGPCLGDGHALAGAEARELERALGDADAGDDTDELSAA